MVTDVTSPLGQAIALGLAMTGAKVLIVAKDDSAQCRSGKGNLHEASQNPNVALQLGDLSNLSSVRNLAEILNSR